MLTPIRNYENHPLRHAGFYSIPKNTNFYLIDHFSSYFTLIAFIAGSLVWMGFVREPLPPIPEITGELSKEVKLNFSINTMDYSGVELALNEKVEGKGMYVQFKMANAWKTGRPGLVVSGIKATKGF